jgi:riboflavin kinase
VTADAGVCEQAHVITPERTHHGDDHLEVIAPVRLRDDLELEDGDEVTVDVEG